MKKSRVIVVGVCGAFVLAGCSQEMEKKVSAAESGMESLERRSIDFVGEVLTATNTGRYVYLEIKKTSDEDDIVWVAATKMDVKPGDKVSVLSAVLMVDFYSPSLKRTFENIYFTGHVLKGDFTDKQSADCPVEMGGASGGAHDFYKLSTNSPAANPHMNPHAGPHGMPKDAIHGMPKDAVHGNPHGSQGMPKGSYHDVHGMPGEK